MVEAPLQTIFSLSLPQSLILPRGLSPTVAPKHFQPRTCVVCVATFMYSMPSHHTIFKSFANSLSKRVAIHLGKTASANVSIHTQSLMALSFGSRQSSCLCHIMFINILEFVYTLFPGPGQPGVRQTFIKSAPNKIDKPSKSFMIPKKNRANIIRIQCRSVKVKLFLCNANSTHLGTNCQPPFSGNQKCSSPPDSLYNSLYVYICES